MFGSTILDIAIGLVFVYLMFSLVCSAAKELVEGLLRHRASDLENAMNDLLGPALAGIVYTHGLIAALSKGTTKPSYIPAQTFALALMDTLVPATAETPGGAQNALTAAVVPLAPSPELRAGASAAAIPGPQQKALLSLIDSAGPDAVRLRENIENWFNDAMDRVTGIYKRRSQNIIFVLGLAIVCVENADSIAIVNALSHDAALRTSLVAAAQEYAKTPVPATPTGQTSTKTIKDVTAEIVSLGLPLGWHRLPEGGQWLEKLLGLVLTALAVSLGAPFWFDTLNRVTNVRAALKPDKPASAKS